MKMRSKLLLALLLGLTTSVVMAQAGPPVNTIQLILPLNASFTPASQANVTLVGNPGPQIACYWLVSHFVFGEGSPVLIVCQQNLPNALSSSNYIQVVPVYPTGVTSVDLLKTATAAPPSGACNCAVATGVTSGAINDQSNSTNSYTLNPFNPSNFTLTIDNEVISAGVTHPILRQNGVFIADLAAGGTAGNPGGSANQIQYNSGGVAFGGLTISGDLTIAVPSGTATVTHSATADAFTAVPTPCTSGNAAGGVDSSGNAINCNPLGGISGPGITTLNNLVCWNSSTGAAVADCGVQFPLPISTAYLASIVTTINGYSCQLGGSCSPSAPPSGSAGGDVGGVYPGALLVQGVNNVPLCTGFTFSNTNNTLLYTTAGSPNPCLMAGPGNGLVNPMNLLGQIIYGGAGGTPTALAGPTSPNGLPYSLISIAASGLATAPQYAAPGIVGRSVTGATDLIATSDCSPKRIVYTGSAAVAVTLPTPTTLGDASCTFKLANNTSNTVTITPTTFTISAGSGGSPGASLALLEGQEAVIFVDPKTASNWAADVTDQALSVGSTSLVLTRSPSGISLDTSGVLKLVTQYGSLGTTGNGVQSIQATSGAVAISSNTSIGTTTICSTTQCPAGTYEIYSYIDVTTACTTTGSYALNFNFTDDAGAKTGVTFPIAGTGASGNVLALSATTNFAQGHVTVRSTGASPLAYTTTATACGTGGPAVGNLYFDVARIE